MLPLTMCNPSGDIATVVTDKQTPQAAQQVDASVAEYQGFLADVTQEVQTRVEKWRIHLGEACAFCLMNVFQNG